MRAAIRPWALLLAWSACASAQAPQPPVSARINGAAMPVTALPCLIQSWESKGPPQFKMGFTDDVKGDWIDAWIDLPRQPGEARIYRLTASWRGNTYFSNRKGSARLTAVRTTPTGAVVSGTYSGQIETEAQQVLKVEDVQFRDLECQHMAR